MKRQADDSDSDDSHNGSHSASALSASSSSCKNRKTKVWYNQPFNNDWLHDSHLKYWIELDPKDRYTVR